MKRSVIALLFLVLTAAISSTANAQNISTTTCPGAGCQDINVAGQGSIGIQITGTWVGTVTFRASLSTSPTGTFTSLLVTPSNSTTAVTTTTANGVWTAPIAGINTVRVVFTAYTSGTAVVNWRITNQARYNPGASGGGGGSGTVTEVTTSSPITGGPITTTGDISCPTCGVTGSALSQFAATTSAQLAGVISNETGSGLLTFATSPTLTTPNLGTPSALTLTNATGLPVGGITGLAAGVGTFLATPSSANLATALTDETGSGTAVFNTSPTLVTPTLGVATATTLNTGNGDNELFPMDQALLTTSDVTFDALTVTSCTGCGAGGGAPTDATYITQTSNGTLSAEQALDSLSTGIMRVATATGVITSLTDSAGVSSNISDETGSGALTFATDPTFTTNITLPQATFTGGSILDGAVANVIDQRNGTSAQASNIYNTYTNSTNYERITIGYAGNSIIFGHKNAGTGVSRAFNILYGNNTNPAIIIPSATTGTITVGAIGTTTTANTTRVNIGNGVSSTATTGTTRNLHVISSGAPTGTSTMLYVPLHVQPTINYSNATPGAGSYEALKIEVAETALPTGNNYLIRASAGAAGTTDFFTVDNIGITTARKFLGGGTAPAVSNTSADSCGTTAASIVGSDAAGKVTVGATSGTSCTVTFSVAYPNAPSCFANNETTANLARAVTTTTTVILVGTFVAGDVVSYNCLGY